MPRFTPKKNLRQLLAKARKPAKRSIKTLNPPQNTKHIPEAVRQYTSNFFKYDDMLQAVAVRSRLIKANKAEPYTPGPIPF